ncbi:MAG TPA: SDR family oxidoreductase [Ktedonobacterales bacterium]|nr:SDR family oxidoreductase [Ktedonobacterales bacterium]
MISGGSRGLGLALAEEFARHGARLAICACDKQELEAERSICTDAGVKVFAEPADMARRDEAERLCQRVADHFGPVDVLVNVAGVITVGPLLDQTLEDFEQVMADNFWTARQLYLRHAASDTGEAAR